MRLPRPTFLKRWIDRRFKRQIVASYLEPQLVAARAWTKSSSRPDNFYYGLRPRNTEHLIELMAVAFCAPRERVAGITEELGCAASVTAAASDLGIAPNRLFGRRLGWYITTRLVRPSLVVETGVHDGIGAVILTEALRRNASEGSPGRYRGTDIDPKAGWLLTSGDVDAKILYGDSIASLETLDPGSVDLFINDSDHSADYEYREYQVMTTRLSARAVILGDNAHATDSLLKYSREMDRDFLFFDERPADHWYPGAGIGISLARAERT